MDGLVKKVFNGFRYVPRIFKLENEFNVFVKSEPKSNWLNNDSVFSDNIFDLFDWSAT